jgi:5'-deoxynucleotidase YfbR-like HD superfamily hydrolase
MIDVRQMLTGEIQRMSSIERYSSYPVIRRENVAEHSWYVTFYALLIARDLKDAGSTVDVQDVMVRALVHDIDESLLGDVVITTKSTVPGLQEALENAAIERIGGLSTQLLGNTFLSDKWKGVKDNTTLEGCVVQTADTLSVLSYIYQEYRFGNKTSTRIAQECERRFRIWLNSLSLDNRVLLGPYIEEALLLVGEI